MARAPVRDIPLSEQLNPVAAPVDTFVKPAQSPLRDLADSLGTVDRSLKTWLDTKDLKAQQDDELRGRAAYYSDKDGEFAQAVTSGQIPAQYSPFYVRGFKNAQGEAAGEGLRTKWQDAWDNWQGKDSDDPKSFDNFFHDFVKQNVGTEDPDVLRGLLPTVQALQANATTQYTQYRHDKTVDGSLTAHGAVIAGNVQSGLDAGMSEPKGADYPAIFKSVNNVVAQQLATGDPGGKAVNTFIDVMSSKILETKDPKLLDWFNQTVPGQTYTYGQTPHGIEVKNATVNSLEVLARQQAAGLSAAEKKAQEKAKDDAQSGIINGILANPDASFDEKLLTQGEKNGDPLIRLHAKQWRDDLTKGTSDPRKVTSFYDDVISGRVPPKQALLEALSHGVFGSAEDMRAAVSFTQNFQTSEDTITKTLNGQVSRQVLEAIRQRTVAKDPTTMNPLAGTSDEGFEASADFRQLVTRWIINNPNATLPEIEEQVQKFGKQITDRFQAPSDPFTEGATYNRDENLPFGNPYDQPNAGQQSDSGQASGSSNPDVQQWEKANNITPDQRKIIEDQAARAGMGYDEFIQQRALKQNQSAPASGAETPRAQNISFDPNSTDTGDGDAPVQGITPERASSYIDQAFTQAEQAGLTGDERTASLRDLIGQGESGGNYNAVYGNPGNNRDLGRYTVDDILGHQQYARQNGSPSTAIGKYGFLYKTLKGLKAEMGLSGNEKFTPQLQDKMADALLNRRGLQSYLNGRISKSTFALSLAQEFASLPVPATGQSYYAGDGLNRARVSRGAVYDALGFRPQPASYDPYNGEAYPGGNPEGKGLARLLPPEKVFPPGTGGTLNFSHPEQSGIRPGLRSALTNTSTAIGRDLTIISGYRSPEHNASVGGAKASEHMNGNAADISMAGMNTQQRQALVQQLLANGVKRFITYTNEPDMLHVDMKDQNGGGSAYFMHDRSAAFLGRAPGWFRQIAEATSSS